MIFNEVAAGPRPANLQRTELDPRSILGLELNRLGAIMQGLVRDNLGLQITGHAAVGGEVWAVEEHGNRLPPIELTPDEKAERDRMHMQALQHQLRRLYFENRT